MTLACAIVSYCNTEMKMEKLIETLIGLTALSLAALAVLMTASFYIALFLGSLWVIRFVWNSLFGGA